MDVFLVELVFHLLPSMFENVLAFLSWLVIEDSFETNRLALAILHGDLLDASLCSEVYVFTLLVWNHHGTADVLQDKLGAVFFQVLTPKVGSLFKRSLVVELVSLRAEDSIAQRR